MRMVNSTLHECSKDFFDSGAPAHRAHIERFTTSSSQGHKVQADTDAVHLKSSQDPSIRIRVELNVKEYVVGPSEDEPPMNAALNAGLNLTLSCKAGVFSTGHCKVFEGQLTMDRKFILDDAEMPKGFALICQARAVSTQQAVSFDHC